MHDMGVAAERLLYQNPKHLCADDGASDMQYICKRNYRYPHIMGDYELEIDRLCDFK